MNKEERITKYGEDAYVALNVQKREYYAEDPEEAKRSAREQSRKSGKRYEKYRIYNNTGLRKARKRVRGVDQTRWVPFKSIIAPLSRIHHEWIPGTAGCRGVALVEADQHMHGDIDVIKILEGKITVLREEEVR